MDDTVSAPVRNDVVDQSIQNTAAQSNKIVEEFRYLLEKSQQLFVGLRELPPTGRNWQSHFQRTFEVYTRIWKFQQQHRAVLEDKDYYDLKRWEIGELASKIGQLYYQYYSRTSETNYLNESFVFYEAIRDRNYFKDVMEAKNAPLVVKKLRYIARFVVVALLLNRSDVVKILHETLTGLVEEYNQAFKPSDYSDWKVVLSEISTFIEADKKLSPIDPNGTVLAAPTRLKLSSSSKFDKDGNPKLKLQEAILVANYQNQIKFAELTLDMYRIMQSLERESNPSPTPSTHQPAQADQTASSFGMTGIESSSAEHPGDPSSAPPSNAGLGGANATSGQSSSRRSNPRKYLLYRPSYAQIALYLATCFKDISDSSAMLLYISADGSKRQSQSNDYTGGVSTALNINSRTKQPESLDQDHQVLHHSLHPQDLTSYTRKPFFLIVDSTNSTAFRGMPNVFGMPFACLLSPTEYPSSIKDITQIGSLFSLFLHSPIKAFAFVSDINTIAPGTWDMGISQMEALERIVSDLLDSDASLDKSYKRFIQDDFLRQFVVRFIITSLLLSSHTAFKDPKNLPVAQPLLPSTIQGHPDLLAKAQELVKTFNVASLYQFGAPVEMSS